MTHNVRARLFALEHFGIKLGLENISRLLEALGQPDRAYRTIHIAGTNGKGSVTAMVERGLRAAGHRTGRYTSPHLTQIEERVAIDGRSISPTAFDEVTRDVLLLTEQLLGRGTLTHWPTFFEVTTAIAFEAFRRHGVGVAVVEVGLGGRFDATNVIEPAVTAITSIAFDHERHLGYTLREIAFEKAGIIKRGVPVVVGPMPDEARQVIEDVAIREGAPLKGVGPELNSGAAAITLALNGGHQRHNASVAVEVLKQCAARGLRVTSDHIRTALTDVEWPARLEWLRLPSGGDVLIDAAHNPNGAEALAAYVQETTGALPLVFAVMKDKDVDAMVRALAPAASRIIATQVASPRALDAPLLAQRIREVDARLHVEEEADPQRALFRALAGSERAMIAGSIFLVGPLRQQLIAEGATPVRYPSKAGLFYIT